MNEGLAIALFMLLGVISLLISGVMGALDKDRWQNLLFLSGMGLFLYFGSLAIGEQPHSILIIYFIIGFTSCLCIAGYAQILVRLSLHKEV